MRFAPHWSKWPRDGVAHNPRAWLVCMGRFKAVDRFCKLKIASRKRT